MTVDSQSAETEYNMNGMSGSAFEDIEISDHV
jgi:hypothetical protein